MIKEKQIEEMAIELAKSNCQSSRCDYCYLEYGTLENSCEEYLAFKEMAEALYNAGYRKQSEDVPDTNVAKWISVDERLPEQDGAYITFTNANGKDNGVIAQYLVTTTIRGKKVRRWEWQARISPWNVTHWMPLPEAPKMKGGE